MISSRAAFTIAAAAAIGAAACTGDSTAPIETPDDLTPTGAVTRTVDRTGGSLAAVTDEGARVVLTFPADAVRQPTEVTIRPVAPAGSSWMQVALEPAGLIFRRPFTLSVTLPEGTDLVDPQLMLGSAGASVPIATGFDRDRRILTTAALGFFGLNADASVPGAGALLRSNLLEGDGNLVGAGSLSCDQIVATANAEFDGFTALGLHEKAIGAILAAGAALDSNRCPGVEPLMERAAAAACAEIGAIVGALRAGQIAAHGDYDRNARLLLHWYGLAQAFGAEDCDAAGDAMTVLDEETADFLTFFSARLGAVTGSDYEAYQDLRDEARNLKLLESAALHLGLPDAAALIDSDAFTPTVHAMRATAYSLCRSDQWHYPLSRMMPAGFFALRDRIGAAPGRTGPVGAAPHEYAGLTAALIADDLQYCATDLMLSTLHESGETASSAHVGTGGGPGLHTGDVELDLPAGGVLRMEGELGGFTCWDNTPADTEVIISLDGAAVHTITRQGNDPYLGDPLELAIDAIADQAGIELESGDTHDLMLQRRRTGCREDLWGPSMFTLANARLTVPGALLRWTFESSLDGWTPGTSSSGGGGGEVRAEQGMAVLRGFENPDAANAWISREIDLPANAEQLRFRAQASCVPGDEHDSMLRVLISSGAGGTETLTDWLTVQQGPGFTSTSVSLSAYAGQTVTIRMEQKDEGQQEDSLAEAESVCIDDIVIS